MNTLSALPWWVILPLSLVAVAALSLALRWVVARVVGDHRAQAAAIAGPLMPAFGVLFAFLTGFAITAMWTNHSAAETTVSQEAGAASTLAWAATAPGADTTGIQTALGRYLDAQLDREWADMGRADPGTSGTNEDLDHLERTVRISASTPSVSQADAGEMLDALDQLAARRAERLGAAGRSMPTAVFLALVLTGLALCLNALVLSLAGTRRARIVTASIISVVAVDLAVLLILSGPFVGSHRVSNSSVVAVRDALDAGVYHR